MVDERILERTESTQIIWKEGKDPTKKKVKKDKKKKKKLRPQPSSGKSPP